MAVAQLGIGLPGCTAMSAVGSSSDQASANTDAVGVVAEETSAGTSAQAPAEAPVVA